MIQKYTVHSVIIWGENKNAKFNNLISVLTYLIYKKYLTDKDNLNTNYTTLLNFVKKELEYKSVMYNLMEKTSEDYIPLSQLLTFLRGD